MGNLKEENDSIRNDILSKIQISDFKIKDIVEIDNFGYTTDSKSITARVIQITKRFYTLVDTKNNKYKFDRTNEDHMLLLHKVDKPALKDELMFDAMSIPTPTVKITDNIVLTDKELLVKGKEAQKYEFLYRKVQARNYQAGWIRNDMFRTTDLDKVKVVFAPTGAGKTTTKKIVLKHINKLTKEKSITCISVPATSQQIIQEYYNDVLPELGDDVGIIIAKAFLKNVSLKNNVHVYNSPIELKEFSKNFKHILVLSSNQFLRTTFINGLTLSGITNGRLKNWFIDEIHKEMHSDGCLAYTPNLENHITQYSSKSKNTIDMMISLGFITTGFSGTPSKQQRGELVNHVAGSGVFDFVDLSPNGLKEVQAYNTHLEKVRFLGKYDNTQQIITSIKKDIYSRPGVGILFLDRANASHTPGRVDINRFKRDIAPSLNRDSVLYWFGGTEKYCWFNGNKISWAAGDSLLDVLKEFPWIKLVVVKELLKDGLNHTELNTVIFGGSIKKVKEFITNEQQIGRGVRNGSVGLSIIFCSDHGRGNSRGKSLIKTVLNRGTICTLSQKKRLLETIDTSIDSIVTKGEAIEIADRINKSNGLEDVMNNLNNVIVSQSTLLYGHKFSLKDISTLITNALENYIGSLDNFIKTAGMEDEDGILYLPKSDKFISFDIKSKVSSVEGTEWFNHNVNNSVILKDKLKGDGKINNHILHIIFDSKIKNNEIVSMNVHISDMRKDYTDEMKSNSLSLIKIAEDLSLCSFSI